MENLKIPDEWIKQSDYDYETAEFMAGGGRNVYAVFMCHLAIEKALKAVIVKSTGDLPPRIHSLIQLTKKSGLEPDEQTGKFLVQLDQASIPTRYPEDLDKLHQIYTKEKTSEILKQTQKVLAWVKQTF